MDALMAALVAAWLAHAADRPAWLAAILADRGGAGPVIAGFALALVLASTVAVAGGVLLQPLLTPEARRLFLGVALVLQGGGAVFPLREPDRLAGWRMPVFAVALIGGFILLVGDGVSLVIAALAAGSTLPWAAVGGVVAGGLAAIVPAVVLGEREWRRLPLTAVRRGAGALFVVVGLVIGLGALGLV
jgi:Ca2+/H+ antiporter, TMEM165/GDT1 family